MNRLEKETVTQIKSDFAALQKKKKLSVKEEDQLKFWVTGVLGWYNLDKDASLKKLAEDMVAFGENLGIDMAGARIELEHINQRS